MKKMNTKFHLDMNFISKNCDYLFFRNSDMLEMEPQSLSEPNLRLSRMV